MKFLEGEKITKKHIDFLKSLTKFEENNWNLADTDTFSHVIGRENNIDILVSIKKVDDIKTFIQKVKEDLSILNQKTEFPLLTIMDIIDKRAGRL